MLLECVSVERTDLTPTPDLVVHAKGKGDNSPAMWRLYARAPYVVKNALACSIFLRVSQSPPGAEATDRRIGNRST